MLRLDWKRPYTTDEWVEQVSTFGGHSNLAPEKLDQLLSGIRIAIDSTGSAFTMRYAALAIIASRRQTGQIRKPTVS
jgi:hypothetical protein